MAQALTRYHTTPPTDVVFLHDMQSLDDYVRANPYGLLHSENGGYYLKDMAEKIVAIASDGLCSDLDGPWASGEAAADAEEAAERESASKSVGDTGRDGL